MLLSWYSETTLHFTQVRLEKQVKTTYTTCCTQMNNKNKQTKQKKAYKLNKVLKYCGSYLELIQDTSSWYCYERTHWLKLTDHLTLVCRRSKAGLKRKRCAPPPPQYSTASARRIARRWLYRLRAHHRDRRRTAPHSSSCGNKHTRVGVRLNLVVMTCSISISVPGLLHTNIIW